MLKLVHLHKNSKKLHSIVKEANKFSRELCLNPVYKNALKPIEFSKGLKNIAKHESMVCKKRNKLNSFQTQDRKKRSYKHPTCGKNKKRSRPCL